VAATMAVTTVAATDRGAATGTRAAARVDRQGGGMAGSGVAAIMPSVQTRRWERVASQWSGVRWPVATRRGDLTLAAAALRGARGFHSGDGYCRGVAAAPHEGDHNDVGGGGHGRARRGRGAEWPCCQQRQAGSVGGCVPSRGGRTITETGGLRGSIGYLQVYSIVHEASRTHSAKRQKKTDVRSLRYYYITVEK